MTKVSLKGDWLLATSFGTNKRQITPLAAQEIDLRFNSRLEWEILHVKGFTLVPNGSSANPSTDN